MNYLTHNGHQLAIKNKLQNAVQEYLSEVDRQLLEGNFKLKLFKKSVIAKIKELNKEHPRCTPLNPTWWSPSKDDYFLSGVPFCHYYIYHSKNTY